MIIQKALEGFDVFVLIKAGEYSGSVIFKTTQKRGHQVTHCQLCISGFPPVSDSINLSAISCPFISDDKLAALTSALCKLPGGETKDELTGQVKLGSRWHDVFLAAGYSVVRVI